MGEVGEGELVLRRAEGGVVREGGEVGRDDAELYRSL